jgi:hypothetical protein
MPLAEGRRAAAENRSWPLLIGWADCLRNVQESARIRPSADLESIADRVVLRETAPARTSGGRCTGGDRMTEHDGSRVGRFGALFAIASLFACDSTPPPLLDCLPKNDLTPTCIFQNPEDLAAVGKWLIVSQLPSRAAPGSLVAFDTATRRILPLYPPRHDALATLPGAYPEADLAAAAGEGAEDGGCAAGEPPPIADFAPHGIDLSLTRLLVVNHGRREAIEEFEMSAAAGALVLTWKSCTPLPDDASANDVVALADGGFAATKMIERPQWLGIAKLLLGMNTGALLRHSPTAQRWDEVPNSVGRAPNGVEVEPDGTFFISEWAANRIVRIEPDGSERKTAPLDFSPDNLSWSARGQLLVAGQRASLLDVPGCAALEEGTCALPSVVVAIDPVTMTVSPLVDDDPARALGAASIAVEQDDALWIGTFAGNRLVKREGAR